MDKPTDTNPGTENPGSQAIVALTQVIEEQAATIERWRENSRILESNIALLKQQIAVMNVGREIKESENDG